MFEETFFLYSLGLTFDVFKIIMSFESLQCISPKYSLKLRNFDSSFPMIINLINHKESKIALRYSEFEKEDTILHLAGRIEWIWIDCFSKIPGDSSIYKKFKKLGFKLCFVSPELQGQEYKIKEYKEYFEYNNILIDAVCSKLINSSEWQ